MALIPRSCRVPVCGAVRARRNQAIRDWTAPRKSTAFHQFVGRPWETPNIPVFNRACMTANSQKNPDRWFPRKRYVLMIASKKACKLSYHQRLVYSYLVFRRSREQGAATSKIANVLRIDREAASRALYRLASEWSLVENRDGRFWACEPTDQTSTWFANNRRDGDP